ncbi:hypothetical protein P3H15_55170, partial [Rhodococcus sp. T2V]|uniref:hypothetical protein n=1 Tax=Rhodococcus sp. T2V TaxID=3034164 RepID=UPI0023E1E669
RRSAGASGDSGYGYSAAGSRRSAGASGDSGYGYSAAVDVPVRAPQQPLHPVRADLAGPLGEGPPVLAF